MKLLLIALPLLLLQPASSQAPLFRDASELVWTDSPTFRGIKATVLQGEPDKPGLYAVRSKFSPQLLTQPHWHPADEFGTVLSGTLHVGIGDRADKANTRPYGPGAFLAIPANTKHFTWNDGEVILQFHGIGPRRTFLETGQ